MKKKGREYNIDNFKKKLFKHYEVGQKLHVVDFDKDKSFIGRLMSMSAELLTIRLENGYSISVSFQELRCKRFGINIVLN